MKRKYINFIIDNGTDNIVETKDWKSCFSAFQSNKNNIIWGLPNQKNANYQVILSARKQP